MNIGDGGKIRLAEKFQTLGQPYPRCACLSHNALHCMHSCLPFALSRLPILNCFEFNHMHYKEGLN